MNPTAEAYYHIYRNGERLSDVQRTLGDAQATLTVLRKVSSSYRRRPVFTMREV